MTDTPTERARENLTEIVSVLVTGIWLVALLTGQWWWLPFMLFGYIVIVPVTEILFDADGDAELDSTTETRTHASQRSTEDADALETLRERYARGELTDEQFERKVEQLLETETLEDVEDRSGPREREPDRAR